MFEILNDLALFVFALTIVATIVVRITPDKADDVKIDLLIQRIHALFQYLPTWGVNPKSKALQEAYKQVSQPAEEKQEN
jgi:hypothetical protein